MKNKLTWWAGIGTDAMLYMTGINKRDFFLNKEACRTAYDKGHKAVIEMFGNRLRIPAPSCVGFSYGHLVSLGAHVKFPDNSEPNVEPNK